MKKTAILVDGGFYRRKAYNAFGDLSPNERADELEEYCKKHIEKGYELYRVFYYDCPPSDANIYHPYLKKQISLKAKDTYKWSNQFYDALKHKRKFAIRFGKMASNQAYYSIKPNIMKKICNGTMTFDDIDENDFKLNISQKGVDMKIGLDIASLAYKKQVEQIILISADSDFVPAAKLARREGIDFILDPLNSPIKPSLFEHIDGLRTRDSKFKTSKK